MKEIGTEEQASDPVEQPWRFAIGQMVSIDGQPGEVIWRRESPSGARDYQVRTAGGELWFAEGDLQAAE